MFIEKIFELLKQENSKRIVYHSDGDEENMNDSDHQINYDQNEEARDKLLSNPMHLSTCSFNKWK